jgi:hypothetical protein
VRFSLTAFTRETSTNSTAPTAILFAAVPAKPATPTLTSTNQTFIQLTLATATDTGNAVLQAHSLEIDDGRSGPFKLVSESMVLSHTI